MKRTKAFFAVLILGLIYPAAVSAQVTIEDVSEIVADNFGGYNARQMSMGGAGIMSLDGSALFKNPANLARVPRIEFNLGFAHQRYQDDSRTIPLSTLDANAYEDKKTGTHLNSVIVTVPYPTYRGSLVFGFGMVRSANFDRVTGNLYVEDIYVNLERNVGSGGINQYGFGFGIDISPRLSFGASAFLYNGKHEINFESDIYEIGVINPVDPLYEYIESQYLGLALKSGLAYQISGNFGLGLTVNFPVIYNIDQDFYGEYYWGDTAFYTEYELKRPYIFSGGFVFRWERLTLLGDVGYIDWKQMAYVNSPEMADYNRAVGEFYDDVFKFNFGGEYVIPLLGLSLRGGYFIDPLPYQKRYLEKNRTGFTAGLGFLIDQVVMVDFAYVNAIYEFHKLVQPAVDNPFFNDSFDLFNESKINQFYMTISYRF